MNKLILLILTVLLASCGGQTHTEASDPASEGTKYVITHFNITFAPDLSNRVNPRLSRRPLTDPDILDILLTNLYPSILRFRRSENQKDKLLVDFINKGLISRYSANTDKLQIDFGQFRNQGDRIDYIMERNHVKRTLRQDKNEMLSEFSRINAIASSNNFGADIWTYFNEGIGKAEVLPGDQPEIIESNTYTNTYRNVLILTTDGYIEAGIFGKGFDLSKNTIDHFKKAFLASGETDLTSFFKSHPEFRIKPVHNNNLKNLEVLVMELSDRSLTPGGAATVHPTDMEIIKLFWSDWLQQSKVKRCELHPYANSRDEAEKIILNFLSVPKIS